VELLSAYPEIAPQVEAERSERCRIPNSATPCDPNIPTLKEQGYRCHRGHMRGFAVPLRPDYVVKTLTDALKKITASKEFVDFMNKNQFGIKIRDQKEFTDFINDQFKTLEGVMEAAGYLSK
jgi:tripartite-type tricarboxylate transporter receptor subunit TctC